MRKRVTKYKVHKPFGMAEARAGASTTLVELEQERVGEDPEQPAVCLDYCYPKRFSLTEGIRPKCFFVGFF